MDIDPKEDDDFLFWRNCYVRNKFFITVRFKIALNPIENIVGQFPRLRIVTPKLNMSNQSKNEDNSVLELFDPQRMIKHLRIVFFAYLKSMEDLPIDFTEMLYDMNLLFEFVEEQQRT